MSASVIRSTQIQTLSPFKEFHINLSANGWGTNYYLTFSINSYTKYSRHVGSTHEGPTHTYSHNLTRPMLDTLKELFGTHSSIDSSDIILSIIMKMIDNPKYFMTHCTNFEETRRKEYALIESKKRELEKFSRQEYALLEENNRELEKLCRHEYALVEAKKRELDKLLEEQQQKKEYYAELEEKIRWIDTKERVNELERDKLAEERAHLLAVKHKLALMKAEFEKEKAQIKSVNLDDFN